MDLIKKFTYTAGNGIHFQTVKDPGMRLESPPIATGYEVNNNQITSNPIPVINAIDIDWNGAFVDNRPLNTTADLLEWISSKCGSGGGGNTKITIIDNNGNSRDTATVKLDSNFTVNNDNGVTLIQLNSVPQGNISANNFSSSRNKLFFNDALIFEVSNSGNQNNEITVYNDSNSTVLYANSLKFKEGFKVISNNSNNNKIVEVSYEDPDKDSYITTDGEQTITGNKTFSGNTTFNGIKINGKNDDYVVLAGGGTKNISDIISIKDNKNGNGDKIEFNKLVAPVKSVNSGVVELDVVPLSGTDQVIQAGGFKTVGGSSNYVFTTDGGTVKLSDIGGNNNVLSVITHNNSGNAFNQNIEDDYPVQNIEYLNFDSKKFELKKNEASSSSIYITLKESGESNSNSGINAIDLYQWNIIPEITNNEGQLNIQYFKELSFRITKKGSLIKDITVNIPNDTELSIPETKINYAGIIDKLNTTDIYNSYEEKITSDNVKNFFLNFKRECQNYFNLIFKESEESNKYIFDNGDEIYSSITSKGKKIEISPIITHSKTNSVNLSEQLEQRYNEQIEINEYHNATEQDINTANVNSIVRFGTPNGDQKGVYKLIVDSSNISYGYIDKYGNLISTYPTSIQQNSSYVYTFTPPENYDEFYRFPILTSSVKTRLKNVITTLLTLDLGSSYPNLSSLIDKVVNGLTESYSSNNSIISNVYSTIFEYGTTNNQEEQLTNIINNYIMESTYLNIDIFQLIILEKCISKYSSGSTEILEDYLVHKYINILRAFLKKSNGVYTDVYGSEENDPYKISDLRGRLAILDADITIKYRIKEYNSWNDFEIEFYLDDSDPLFNTPSSIVADYSNPNRAYYEVGNYNNIAYKTYHPNSDEFLRKVKENIINSGRTAEEAESEVQRYINTYNSNVYETMPSNMISISDGTSWFDDPTGEALQIMYGKLIKREYDKIISSSSGITQNNYFSESILFITDSSDTNKGKYIDGSIKFKWSDIIS